MRAKEVTLALNELTVQVVGSFLGLKLPLRGMTRCPLEGHEDSNPSFEVRGSGRRWICYGCDRHGGPIDLVMEFRGLSFIDAKHWLMGKTGIGTQAARSASGRDQSRAAAAITWSSQLTSIDAPEPPPDHGLYGELLARSSLTETGRHYLYGRSLNDATIFRFSIGQMPAEAEIRDLVRQYGFARVETAGLLTKSSTPERFWPIFPKGAILFPYIEGGNVSYLQARQISEEVKGGRWRNLNHRKRRIFNLDVLSQPHIGRVAICEGAIDVMSAVQLGYEAVGLIGVSASFSDAQFIAMRGKQIDLLLDWDEAGEKRVHTLLKEFARFGVSATRKSRPSDGAIDVNDYLREAGDLK